MLAQSSKVIGMEYGKGRGKVSKTYYSSQFSSFEMASTPTHMSSIR